ncbi:MAG: ornithine cyclodeaminase family protein [candidate division Zixibacteria bacterium]|nr:ornithine cyclodeaminase family protein [candidate division Zixibacteria bacterium]MDH3938376.1 ornithine cyclodeaminase family protein [candidate division Zixibacteria bacterium]
MLVLSHEDVKAALTMPDVLAVIEQAFVELSSGQAIMPQRMTITTPGGTSFYMPGYLAAAGALACKVVSVFKNNPERGLTSTTGALLLQDPETGEVIALMDGAYLTAIRTGAASGLATKYLARDEDGMIASVIGAGVQGKMQLRAIAAVRHLSRALVHDLSDQAAAGFRTELEAELRIPITCVDSAEQALEADIVSAATTSSTPLFDGRGIHQGTHINAVGAHGPEARELDTAAIVNSKFVVDSRTAAMKESGELLIPLEQGRLLPEHVYAELGEIITDQRIGRENNAEITLFKSNGLAVQDTATAKLAYDRAVRNGLGTVIEI